MNKLVIALALIICFSSCATIFTGTRESVTFDSDIDGEVTLTVDGYKLRNVELPYTVMMKGGFNETYVRAEAEGYEDTQVVVYKKFNAVSIINLGFVPGWGIDAATGAITKPEYRFYELEFKEKSVKLGD